MLVEFETSEINFFFLQLLFLSFCILSKIIISLYYKKISTLPMPCQESRAGGGGGGGGGEAELF